MLIHTNPILLEMKIKMRIFHSIVTLSWLSQIRLYFQYIYKQVGLSVRDRIFHCIFVAASLFILVRQMLGFKPIGLELDQFWPDGTILDSL